MKRLVRQILRAARFLEQEADEYVQAGKEADTDEDKLYLGHRAQRMKGVALSLRDMVRTGKFPTRKREDELLKVAAKREFQSETK